MKVNNCHLCQHHDLDLILSLPKTPPANALVSDPKEEQECFPLDLYRCNNCQHYQLLDIVPQEQLYKDYKYVSGTSPVFVRHFRNYACDLVSNFNPEPNDLAVDIGSNDGTLLKQFKNLGMRVLGVDPAEEIAKKATEEGIETLPVFFNEKVAKEIVAKYGKAKFITMNNAFAHNADLDTIVNGMKILLDDNGIISIEVQYFNDLVNNNYFDMIYHEHLHYWTATSFQKYIFKNDMYLLGAKRVNTHGGSVRFFIAKNTYKERFINNEELNDLISFEEGNFYVRPLNERVVKFTANINKQRNNFKNLIFSIKKENKSIVGYGCPAKFTTMAYEFGIHTNSINYIIDDSPWKQGLFTPGHNETMHFPIVPSSKLYEDHPDYTVIFAWNFAESIMKKARENGYKGKFIIPLPHLLID